MKCPHAPVAVLATVAAGVLSACTVGTPFVRPPPDVVRLGETTRAQIVERLGKPQSEQQAREDDRLVVNIAYFFGSDMEAPRMQGTVCVRVLGFVLSDDVVVGEHFLSSCASDHTDFDERKAADIVKGKTTCDEVVAMMGPPTSRAIYPAIKNKGDQAIGYMFQYTGLPGQKTKDYRKTLEVSCDQKGVVRETSFSEARDR